MAQSGKASLKTMLKTVLLTSLVFTVPIVGARWLGWFEAPELTAYDDFIRRRPLEKPDDRIVIVTISDADIYSLKQYPIHDKTIAELLEKLESYQPNAIGLDIARDIPYGPSAGWERLTQIIQNNENIFSACYLSNDKNPGSPPAPGTPYDRAASTDFLQDSDKAIRQVSLVGTPGGKFSKLIREDHDPCKTEGNQVYALSLLLASLYVEKVGINAPDEKAEIQLGKQIFHRLDSRFGSYTNVDTGPYPIMLNYRGAKGAFREVSISDVLNDKVDPKLIRGRIVLIGNISDVSKDSFSTPYLETGNSSREMYGVVAHAHATSQIISAVLDQRPLIQSWSEIVEILWIWVWALGSGLIAFYNRRLGWFLIGLIGTGVALWGICYGLFLSQGLWIPLVPALWTAILTAVGVRFIDLAERTGYAQAISEQLQEQIQGTASDRRGDYLEDLVRRARNIRLGHQATALLSLETEPDFAATPAMKALYEQVATKVRQEMAAEQMVQTTTTQSSSSSKVNRIQSLLDRARSYHAQFLEKSTPNPTENTSSPKHPNDPSLPTGDNH